MTGTMTRIPGEMIPPGQHRNDVLGIVSSGGGVWSRWVGRPMTTLRRFTIEANEKRWTR